jgi:hypothetical protein
MLVGLFGKLLRMLQIACLGLFGKLLLRRSMRGALLTWFHGVWTCGVEVFFEC